MEDEDSKARRNILALASGVLAVWFLQIPIDGHLIGIADLKDVPPWKAWLLSGALLAYFGLRFHHAPETAKTRRQWAEMWRRTRRAVLAKRLSAMRPNGGDSKFAGVHLQGLEKLARDIEIVRVDAQGKLGDPVDAWNGVVQVLPKWKSTSTNAGTLVHPATGQTYEIQYRISFRMRVWLTAAMCLRAILPQWVLLELVPPYVGALAALGLCIAQTILTYQ